MPGDPFQIDILPDAPMARAAFTAARPFLEWLMALNTFRALYQKTHGALPEPFETRVLRALNITIDVSAGELDNVPNTGPVIVAANHPHGLVDGLVLMSALRRVRPDIRVLTNQLLSRIPELRDGCLFVDPFDGPGAEARSRAGLRAAHMWLRRGGALIVFPAGEVAHGRRVGGGHVDSPWKPAMGRLTVATGAMVIPAFIHGGNGRAFYAAGRIHSVLRTLLLPRELLKKRDSSVAVRFGPHVQLDQLAGSASATTAIVRQSVENLRTSASRASSRMHSTDSIAAEVAGLPIEDCLVESGPFQVFCVRAEQIPATLLEIGRLRAVTFRAVGEGSDRALDLDRFDERYLHLFSWDRDRRRIVGAYRIGQTDRIVADAGVDGLYTRTLFRYDERLIQRMSAPALELGRSFVRSEYQRNYNALLLLWKGIGRFIALHPQYRLLFGPVSISTRYSDASHQLLMSFLRQNHFATEFGELVDAFHTPRLSVSAASSHVPQSIDEVNGLVKRAESDGKGMPVLLRQYLKLNARLIGFNVDPAFGEVLDALMIVDLVTADPAILNRYLGLRDAANFLAFHRRAQPARAA